jgi:hypothetical protein
MYASPPTIYDQDGLTTGHNHEFMSAPRFVAAYQRGVAAAGRDYNWHWRVHIGLWAADTAVRLPGDFVECGVNRGFMSSSIMAFLDWDRVGKHFYLLDTFRGLDERYVTETETAEGIFEKNASLIESGFYTTESDSVRRNFAEWQNVTIIEGPIPDTLPHVAAREVAFLHIDLNCAPPEIAALEHFWPLLGPGAIVLLDDYAFAGYRQQKLAMDDLAERLDFAIASLPTGQGLIVKT